MTAQERIQHERARLVQLARACREYRLAFRRAWAKHERGEKAEPDFLLAEGYGRIADRLILAALALDVPDRPNIVPGPKLLDLVGAKKKGE